MCDWCSWIKKDGKVYYLTDDMIAAKWPNYEVRDKIGHSAIEEYFPESKGGVHFESPIKIPAEIAREVNKGHCDAMLKAGGWAGARYSKSGNLNSPWWGAIKQLIKEVKQIKYFSSTGVICNNWKVFETRGAAWDAARGDAWDAAGDAALDDARYESQEAAWHAERGAAWDAAGDAAWDAARGAAWDAARFAAQGAARGDAWDAAVDAARGAALLVMCTVAYYYDPENRHYKYAQSRFDVWRSGYGLLCDIDGVLYVYKKP